jgi:hypothetical protein
MAVERERLVREERQVCASRGRLQGARFFDASRGLADAAIARSANRNADGRKSACFGAIGEAWRLGWLGGRG